MGWIFKIFQFFEYQATPEEECITLASFYLDGSTLSWFQWSYRNDSITSWPGFLQALESRFALTYYDDPKGSLFKLTEWGFINDYLIEFERLANRIIGLPPPFLLSCFISGLSPDIRREVLAMQPISLPHATTLAKLQVDKIQDWRRPFKSTQPTLPNPFSQNPPPPSPSLSNNRQPFIHRTPEEMASCREKGLCYNCDEKWNASHKCPSRIFLLITEPEDTPIDPHPNPDHFPQKTLTISHRKPWPWTRYPTPSLNTTP